MMKSYVEFEATSLLTTRAKRPSVDAAFTPPEMHSSVLPTARTNDVSIVNADAVAQVTPMTRIRPECVLTARKQQTTRKEKQQPKGFKITE